MQLHPPLPPTSHTLILHNYSVNHGVSRGGSQFTFVPLFSRCSFVRMVSVLCLFGLFIFGQARVIIEGVLFCFILALVYPEALCMSCLMLLDMEHNTP